MKTPPPKRPSPGTCEICGWRPVAVRRWSPEHDGQIYLCLPCEAEDEQHERADRRKRDAGGCEGK